MNTHQNCANAWKLPAFALVYIFVSYLAEAWAKILMYGEGPYWLHFLCNYYVSTWFSTHMWLTLSAWVLCHAGLGIACLRYYHSGSTRQGWMLVSFGFLCSATGGYYLNFIPFILQA